MSLVNMRGVYYIPTPIQFLRPIIVKAKTNNNSF